MGTCVCVVAAAAGALLLVSVTCAGATTPPAPPSAALPAAMGIQGGSPSLREQAELDKLRAEVEKLRVEIATVEALGPRLRSFTTLMTAVGGLLGALFGAVIAGVIAYIGHRITNKYNEVQSGKLEQEREKLRQDRMLGREKHDLELYQGLGNASSRAQFAAAAVLLQRLESVSNVNSRNRPAMQDAAAESADSLRTIVHVLIALLKEQTNDPNFRVLQKHVADNLVKAIGLIEWSGNPSHLVAWDELPAHKGAPDSFFAKFDLQRARLDNVFWRGANLRGVDFYEASLKEASLRNADLRRVAFYKADLSDAILRDARLDQANFEGAMLAGANLTGATMAGVHLKDASFDQRTRWPEGFDPSSQGAVLSGAAVPTASAA